MNELSSDRLLSFCLITPILFLCFVEICGRQHQLLPSHPLSCYSLYFFSLFCIVTFPSAFQVLGARTDLKKFLFEISSFLLLCSTNWDQIVSPAPPAQIDPPEPVFHVPRVARSILAKLSALYTFELFLHFRQSFSPSSCPF